MTTDDSIDVDSTDRTPAVRQHAAVVSPTTPPAEWNVIVAQADVLARSMIVPAAYRNRPENIIAAAITGRQFGWDVMAAMRNTHVIEGSVAIKPEAQVGLVRAAGHSISGSSSSTEATVTGTRADTGDTMTVVWTIDDAKAANLTSKAVWKQYPSDMLWARAVSQLCRRLFPDVTLGLSYTPDELDHSVPAAAPDFSGDVADPAAAATPAPPDGWESWEECEAAHDALSAAVKAAPEGARNQWKGYLRDAGYKAWFTRAQHDELAAQLEILVGAPTERVATTIPEAEVVEEQTDENPVGDEVDGPSALTLDIEPAAAAPTPEALPLDVPAPGGGVMISAVPRWSDSGLPQPAPEDAEPMNKALLNRLGALTRDLGLTREQKLGIASFIVQGPVETTKGMSRADGTWLAGALRHLRDGHLSMEVDADGNIFLAINDPTDGAGNPEVLPGAIFLRDFAKAKGLPFQIQTID